VRALNPVIDPFVGAVVGIRSQLPDRFDIAAQLVRDDNAGLAKTGDQLPQEAPGRFGVSPWLHQNVEHITIPINRPPQPHLNTVDWDHDFIEVPFVSRYRPVALHSTGEMPTKPVHPFANGFPADDYASLGEQILYIRCTQSEPVVDPHGVSDDFAGEPVTFQAGHLSWYFHGDRLNSTAADDKLAIPMGGLSCRNHQVPRGRNQDKSKRGLRV